MRACAHWDSGRKDEKFALSELPQIAFPLINILPSFHHKKRALFVQQCSQLSFIPRSQFICYAWSIALAAESSHKKRSDILSTGQWTCCVYATFINLLFSLSECTWTNRQAQHLISHFSQSLLLVSCVDALPINFLVWLLNKTGSARLFPDFRNSCRIRGGS